MLGQSLPCVLVIDADVAQQQVIARLLYGRYKVLWCAAFADARGLMAAYHPRVLFVDVDLPSEPPFSWIRSVRQDRRWQDLPIVCVSARASVATKVLAFQTGANDFLVKPFAPQAFVAHMELLVRVVAMQR